MQRGSRRNRILDYWVGIPFLNLLATLRRRRTMPPVETIRRIGLMCSPALGDTLLFSAVLADVRRHFASAHLVHFCMRQNLASAEIVAGADERVLLDLTDPRASVHAVRSARVDILLDFSAWQRLTAFLTFSSGARFTAGFRTPGQARGRAYDKTALHRRDQHELENFRDLLRVLAIPAVAEPAVVLRQPAAEPLPGERDLLVLHLWAAGARSHLREWPEPRWQALAERLAQPETLFVVTGAPADMPRMKPFVERLTQAGLRAIAYPGSEGFVGLAAVLRRARLAVSVNTGVMHLAAILGTPTLSLNGPTAGHRWGPVGRCVAGVTPADGSGGYLHLGFEFDGQPEDVMERITVEQATEAAEALLARCGTHLRHVCDDHSSSSP